ncbi:MAG: GntR family transcriptional regulator [Gemmatimonadaceae bacterium]|jgi:GntR family transcriptional regulator|nr:GntR family transcriptional regulator [Gemmatimonadaceae bacterium]
MLPFAVTLVPGESPYRQVVYAATKAVVSGDLAPGAPFPSVRELSQALKINPNTAHKVVAELVRDGLLEVLPGVGTVVARARKATAREQRDLLKHDVETLLVEARRLGIARAALQRAIDDRWNALFGSDDPTADADASTDNHNDD